MTTEKKLEPRILAMYLGSKAIGQTTRDTWSGTLAGIYSDLNVHIRMESGEVSTFRPGEVKPILRRLSSMTEEEAIAMYNEMFPKSNTPDGFKAANIKCQLDTNGISAEGYAVSIFDYVNWFPYLLSRGFDLFGLIDSGEAIEAKPGE